MTILTRYLLRSLTGPFLFSFTLLTGLLFVNTVAQQLEDWVGKGLPREIILEALVLSLPHTIAVTLPMAVLPAVLYAFSELATHSEIVAMSSGGVRPRRIFLPVLFFGLFLTGVTYVFNDQILPEANHRLKNLRNSIRQKSPTFQLREQAVNRIEADNGLGPWFLVAESIDQDSATMTGVTIHDMSRQGIRRTTYAERGRIALSPSFTDLHLRLFDGRVYEVGGSDGTLEAVHFERQVQVLRGIGNIFQDSDSDQRSDREMSVAMLLETARARSAELDTLLTESAAGALSAVERALGEGRLADSARTEGMSPHAHTFAMQEAGVLPADDFTRILASTSRTHAARVGALSRQVNQYRVEVNKKMVIATACLIFVLVGVPVGIRFPRGGVSMVVAVSAVVIGVYQWGLTSGEKWADRNLMDPALSMWSPSIVWFILGSLMVARLGRWISSARGGGWQELATLLRRLGAWRPGGRRAPPGGQIR